MEMPKRGSYSQLWKVCRKLGLRKSDGYLLKDLLKDEDFEDYAIGKLNNTEKRMLGIRSKKRKKKTDPILAENHLMRWI